MKSGTNWLGSLLSSHETVSCVGEFHWHEVVARFNELLRREPIFEDEEYRELCRQKLEHMIQQCLVAAAEPTATVIGDRTPHTIVPITLRNVPYISIIRDGRDILVSRAFHLYNAPGVHRLFKRIPAMAAIQSKFVDDPWYFRKHPEDLLSHETMVRESLKWWRDHLQSDRDAVHRFPKLKIYFVKYEDLHRDTAGERQKLFEFLDVDPKRASKLTGVLKPGFESERPDQFLRKGSVGDWKNYFTDEVKAWFKEEAGQTLIDQGYESSNDW